MIVWILVAMACNEHGCDRPNPYVDQPRTRYELLHECYREARRLNLVADAVVVPEGTTNRWVCSREVVRE